MSKASLAGVLAVSALVPVAVASAATSYAVDEIIVTVDGQNVAISKAVYDAAIAEGWMTGATVSYVQNSDGKYYSKAVLDEAVSEESTLDKALELLAGSDKAVTITTVPGEFVEGNLVPQEEQVADLKVESVSAIEPTIVEVTFPALAEAVTDATVEVKDNTGKVHEVVAQDLAKGATTAQFDFVTPITGDFEGVWTVNGVEYSFDELALVEDIVAAAGANNEVSLNKLLADAGIKNVNVDRISDYLSDITTANSKAPLVWASDVQKVIDATNEKAGEEADEAAVVKAVADATNQVQLLAALEANFDRVNADWIAQYATENVTLANANTKGLLALDEDNYFDVALTGTTEKAIQNAIDSANNKAIYTGPTALDNKSASAADQVKVTTAIQNWIKPDAENQTNKADKLAASKAKEAAFRVAEATTENSLYNALVAYANATPDSVLKASDLDASLKSYYKKALDASGVQAALITQIKTDHADATHGVTTKIVTAAETAQLKDAVKAVKDLDQLTKSGSPADYTKAEKEKALNALQKLAAVSSDVKAEDLNSALITEYIDAIQLSISTDASNVWSAGTDTQKAAAVQLAIDTANDPSTALSAIAAGNDLGGTALTADTLISTLTTPTLNLDVVEANKTAYFAELAKIKTKAAAGKADLQNFIKAIDATVELNKATTASAAKTALDKYAVSANNAPYLNQSTVGKSEVANLVLNAMPSTGYADTGAVYTAINNALSTRTTLINGVNNATNIVTTNAALDALDYKAFEDLSATDKVAVAEKFFNAIPVDEAGDKVAYKSFAAIYADIDKAIAATK